MPYDPTQLDEALYGLATFLNAGKASFDDDGKLTISDAPNFISAVIPVWNGVKDAQLAIVNIDQMTAEQKEASKIKFLAVLDFHPTDENAFDKVLNLLFALLEVLVATGVIKPAEEPPAEAATDVQG